MAQRRIMRRPFKGQSLDFETYASLVQNAQSAQNIHDDGHVQETYRYRFAKIVEATNTVATATEVYYDTDTSTWETKTGGYTWDDATLTGYNSLTGLSTDAMDSIETDDIVMVACQPRNIAQWHIISGAGGGTPIVYECLTANTVSKTLTAKRIDSLGNLVGEQLTFTILAD
jgi:hypothetical protein